MTPRPATDRPLFIGSEIYRHSRYARGHPLAIPRVSTVIDLCRALGWLPDEVYLDSPRASPAALARYHDPTYIEAVQTAEETGTLSQEDKVRFNIGLNGNPIFPEIFSRPATACGASLLAARLVRDGGIVHNPAGGTHHGRPDRASGFCYFNDPVLGILALLEQGLAPVLYLDMDAHHGDGVEYAFADDPRVITVSVHEAGRWPGTGLSVADRRRGVFNLPVPAGFNDSEMAFLLEHVILPVLAWASPRAVVLQCGADALEEDPLSRLALSNRAYRDVVAAVAARATRLIALGGGGYNPWSVARCWTLIWGTLNGLTPPERLPEAARAVLAALSWRHSRGRNPPEHWMDTLLDAPRPGPVRTEVRALAAAWENGAGQMADPPSAALP